MDSFVRYESDGLTPVYFEAVRARDITFRGILKHMINTVQYMPTDLDPDAPLEDLMSSIHPKRNAFYVADFSIGRQDTPLVELVEAVIEKTIDPQTALIAAGTNMSGLSGWGRINAYTVLKNGEPEFLRGIIEMRS